MHISSYRGRREPIPEEETAILACTSSDCKGWMRKAFSFEKEPNCPICNAAMKEETRVLPVIR